MKRRPNILIYMEALRLLLEGPRGPSRMQQALGLNYTKFMEFAAFLESKDLIRKEVGGEHELFYITPAGVDVHQRWRTISEKLGDVS